MLSVQGDITMTIVEAIKVVLNGSPGMTSQEIYNEIVQRKLYSFGAVNPAAVVNGEIRRRCFGLDFPTAYPIKVFETAGFSGKKLKFKILSREAGLSTAISQKNHSEQLPEEVINNAIKDHLNSLKQDIFNRIFNNTPDFFERLVVDLLLKMGYGYDKTSGIVTGKPHDGGIDGIISEDRLDLGLIYIQAKRNSRENKVGRKEIQAFIGAMQHIQKGVFITTSSFTKEASDFVSMQQQKRIKLIDGDALAALLVKYEVGLKSVSTFSLYKIDSDYYGAQ